MLFDSFPQSPPWFRGRQRSQNPILSDRAYAGKYALDGSEISVKRFLCSAFLSELIVATKSLSSRMSRVPGHSSAEPRGLQSPHGGTRSPSYAVPLFRAVYLNRLHCPFARSQRNSPWRSCWAAKAMEGSISSVSFGVFAPVMIFVFVIVSASSGD